jgi:hypothetical protein
MLIEGSETHMRNANCNCNFNFNFNQSTFPLHFTRFEKLNYYFFFYTYPRIIKYARLHVSVYESLIEIKNIDYTSESIIMNLRFTGIRKSTKNLCTSSALHFHFNFHSTAN